jgi:hypothetical protein
MRSSWPFSCRAFSFSRLRSLFSAYSFRRCALKYRLSDRGSEMGEGMLVRPIVFAVSSDLGLVLAALLAGVAVDFWPFGWSGFGFEGVCLSGSFVIRMGSSSFRNSAPG